MSKLYGIIRHLAHEVSRCLGKWRMLIGVAGSVESDGGSNQPWRLGTNSVPAPVSTPVRKSSILFALKPDKNWLATENDSARNVRHRLRQNIKARCIAVKLAAFNRLKINDVSRLLIPEPASIAKKSSSPEQDRLEDFVPAPAFMLDKKPKSLPNGREGDFSGPMGMFSFEYPIILEHKADLGMSQNIGL